MNLFGYKYTDFAPSAKAFQKKPKSVSVSFICMMYFAYIVHSANALEARVPFGDLDFVKYVMALDPEMKMNQYGKGKYLLRKAFEESGYLPDEILWREKAASF